MGYKYSKYVGFRLFVLACVVSLLCAGTVWARPHEGVRYVKVKRAGVSVHVVDIDLKRDDLVVRPVVVPTGHRESFTGMMRKHRPLAAVNGTFFDTNTGITVGNLVSDGRLLSEGMVGSNLVFKKDGTTQLLSSSRNLGRYKDWSDVDFAIGGGPTLVSNHKFFMDPASEGFRDPSLFKARPRSAVGVTKNGHLRMVVTTQGISLWKLAHVMKELNCVHAINLDGGSSTGLSVGGTTMVNPSRQMTNILGVFASHMEPAQKRAVQVAQSRALGHYNKGQKFLKKGNARMARSQMRQAVAKAPEQAGFWKAAGYAEFEYGNYDRGVLDLKKASSLYESRGQLSVATKLSEKILSLRPEDVSAHLACGRLMMEQGHDTEARGHLKYVLEAQPGHPGAAKLLGILNLKARAYKDLRSSVNAASQVFQVSLR